MLIRLPSLPLLAGLALVAAVPLAAAEEDRITLNDGRVLTGEYLGGDADTVRFALGSSVQVLPRRKVRRIQLAGDLSDTVASATPAPAPAPVTTQVITQQVVPVYVAPPPPYHYVPAPYVTSGWSLSYGVGDRWGRGRHGGWGLGWTYGVGHAWPGWCAPNPWCR